jgi:hypothetical protein
LNQVPEGGNIILRRTVVPCASSPSDQDNICSHVGASIAACSNRTENNAHVVMCSIENMPCKGRSRLSFVFSVS